MTEQIHREITKRFKSYVDTFRDQTSTLPTMLQLKLTHTMHVVKDATSIMKGEKWSIDDIPTGQVCALLHDIGRFSQFTEFGTFRDSDSIDHARRGVEVINQLNILDGINEECSQRIINAVREHNKKVIPSDMDEKTATLAHLVRDADKLDIFRVMESAVKDGSIESNPEITWGLELREAPNPELVKSILDGKPVDYSLIHALSDFILIQIGWVISGFHNSYALKIIAERNVVEFRREYLRRLTNDPAVDRCCDKAARRLNAGCNSL